jgi:hypothetical protein
MKNYRTQALARLRAADPALAVRPDRQAPEARAMLETVLVAREETPRKVAPVRRRLAIGLAGAAAVAAVSTIAVLEPWSGGDPASAYTLGRNPDGSLAVTFQASRLTDPARLNAELAREGARTIVMTMVPAGRCAEPSGVVPLFQRVTDSPVDYSQTGDEAPLIIIKPWLIPAGEMLVLGYAVRNGDRDRTTMVRPVLATSPPPCLAIPTRPIR